jgi:predicted O-methyltransferase YrrM
MTSASSNYSPEHIRSVIDELVAQGTAISSSDGTHHDLFPVAISPREGEGLRDWVIRERAKRTIEIGLGYGISTLYICEALALQDAEGAQHLAIDPHQATRFANCGLQFLADAGVRNLVEHHAEESQVFLPRLVGTDRQFDFAFVDGNHRFDGVFLDLIYLGKLLRPGRVVFLDDFQLPGVAKAASFCLTNLRWTLEESSSAYEQHHWAVLRTPTDTDDRTYDYFVDF